MINSITDHTTTSLALSAKILIFDSGVGGLSILQEIRQQFPNCVLFYGSDNAAFPYGTKTEGELIERVDLVLHQLQTITQADIIIVACNTASTVALPRIRERFSQPVVGVVPAIKPAAKISQSKVIGLLATEGTIKRPYTDQLIKDFASDCDIVKLGSNELVHLAESKLLGNEVTLEQLRPIVDRFQQYPTMDTVVLACTHFPLLKSELQQALPSITHWIDSGEAIANRTGYWLNNIKTEQRTSTTFSTAYFTSRNGHIPLSSQLQSLGIENIKYLSI